MARRENHKPKEQLPTAKALLLGFLFCLLSGSFCNQNCDLNPLWCQTHFAFARTALENLYRLVLLT